jgi:hypothetical protein
MIEARNGIKPVPGSLGLPIPNLRLKKKNNKENPIKERLLIRFNHFINVSHFFNAGAPHTISVVSIVSNNSCFVASLLPYTYSQFLKKLCIVIVALK